MNRRLAMNANMLNAEVADSNVEVIIVSRYG